MFFDKSWSEVTNDDIDTLAEKLKTEMGGWVFHSKVDFEKEVPHMTLNAGQPEVMKR